MPYVGYNTVNCIQLSVAACLVMFFYQYCFRTRKAALRKTLTPSSLWSQTVPSRATATFSAPISFTQTPFAARGLEQILETRFTFEQSFKQSLSSFRWTTRRKISAFWSLKSLISSRPCRVKPKTWSRFRNCRISGRIASSAAGTGIILRAIGRSLKLLCSKFSQKTALTGSRHTSRNTKFASLELVFSRKRTALHAICLLACRWSVLHREQTS